MSWAVTVVGNGPDGGLPRHAVEVVEFSRIVEQALHGGLLEYFRVI